MATLSKAMLESVLDRFEQIDLPAQVSSPQKVSDTRIGFMVRNTLDSPQDALEKIRGTNNLTSVATLLRGYEVGLSVGLVYDRLKSDIDSSAIGTGFLIAPNLLITNNHVIDSIETAKQYGLMMNYQRDLDGSIDPCFRYAFTPETVFYTNPDLDFTIVSVSDSEISQKPRRSSSFGYLKLFEERGKIQQGEFAALIEHANGKPKQVVLFENEILYTKHPGFLLYSTDTEGGASGSPVFNYDWLVVALHHAGVPESIERLNAIVGDQVEETNFPRAANEGVRISAIMADLKANHLDYYTLINKAANAPLEESLPLRPFEDARVDRTNTTIRSPLPSALEKIEPGPVPETTATPSALINTTMNDNVIRISIPLEIRLGALPLPESVALSDAQERVRKQPSPAVQDLINQRLTNRSGYQATFLENLDINLGDLYKPFLDKNLVAPTLAGGTVLDYTHFSVVMHKVRKMCLLTGVNIDGTSTVSLPRSDNWQLDGRMDVKFQLGNAIYTNNDLDRGHMVRREDPNWGAEAAQANEDTFHYTNSCPQHKDLNQKTWLSLEDYVLKNTRANKLNVSVFTGPVLDENYVLYREALVPVQFYKIVAVIKEDGKPSVTGYVLSQRELLSSLERVQTEFIFGQFKTYQVSLEKLEELTTLNLSSLKPHDPLKAALESVPREIISESDIVL